VEANAMRVEDAQGLPPTIPFWFGESPGRTRELSEEVSALRREIAARRGEPPAWLEAACGVAPDGAVQLAQYGQEGDAALGAVPGTDCVVAERFFDEAGGMQLVLHAPFGARINRAMGLALRKRFCLGFDFELQAAATDDGIVLSLGAQHSFPLESIFAMLLRDGIAKDLTQAALQSPMFANRWRWNATRSLALLRHEAGKKVPIALQRMRAEDLLAAVFPAQLGCQDNRPGGPIDIPDHPLVTETVENCLHEAMDLEGLEAVLDAMRSGAIRQVAIDTVAPSPFSHEILHSNPYSFLDDAPLEERRARAVQLRQTMPQLAGGLGALDPAAIDEVARQAWPTVRDADELHDVLCSCGVLPRAWLERSPWAPFAEQLVGRGRATWGRVGDGAPLLVAAERLATVRLALPGLAIAPAVREPLFHRAGGPETEEEALRAIVGGWLECAGVVTVAELAERMGIAPTRVAIGLAQLEQTGVAMRGRHRPGATDEEWCERGLLARIHRLTLGRLRKEIEPVTAADLMRFLFRWQHVQPGTRLHGRLGLLEVLTQLQGLELPARAWEEQILPARISRYEPDELEHLCLAGAVAWGRLRPGAPSDDDGPARLRAPGRAAPLAFVLREDLPWLLGAPPATPALPPAADAVLRHLRQRGASFAADVARATGLAPAHVDEALWTLVAQGLVTGDGVAGLRLLIDKPDDDRRLRMLRGGRARLVPAGRWALLRDGVDAAAAPDAERWARLLLRRWGVVLRELLARETGLPPWRELVAALRRLEARGEVRGGRFVAGTVGEQFALPEAVETLRAVRRRQGPAEVVTIAAADPLNLVGILVPGARINPAAHETITWRDGEPVRVAASDAADDAVAERAG
jgi:ATP-dependent Lhr-like helicase